MCSSRQALQKPIKNKMHLESCFTGWCHLQKRCDGVKGLIHGAKQDSTTTDSAGYRGAGCPPFQPSADTAHPTLTSLGAGLGYLGYGNAGSLA